MTTGNEVETEALEDVLYIPLDALLVEQGVPIVFKRSGSRVIKQEVATGAMNYDEVVILKGVEEGETVLLTPPMDRESMELVRLPGSQVPPPTGPSGDTAQKSSVPSAPPTTPPAPPRKD
jgi:hypothetical protein